jgi:hypothetical protein
VAAARSSCLYCGTPLPGDQVAAAEISARRLSEPATEGGGQAAERELVVLDLKGAAPEPVAAALGLTRYEARQRVRRSGYQLHLVAPSEQATAETARLKALGLAVTVVPEAEIRAACQPHTAQSASFSASGIEVESGAGRLRLVSTDLLLVVRGAITRQYATGFDSPTRIRSATLGIGHRFHLHRRHTDDHRPLELDADSLELRGERRFPGSCLLELDGWVKSQVDPALVDSAFDRLVPALSPAAAASGSAAALSAGGGIRRREAGPTVLDNVGQFRYYSGWRAGVARRVGRRG